jgi:hypothetical protein
VKKTVTIFFWTLLSLICISIRAAEFVLADEGRSLAPIVIFEGAPPLIREAADELATYIEKICGARPKIIEGEPETMPKHAIWIGYQPVLKRLFPAIDFEFRQPEEILIAATERHVVIAGRDRWNEKHLKIRVRDKPVEGVQQEYGTVNAVYTFIQDYLGVRWLWPGELGEDVIRRERLVVAPLVFRYHPGIRARGGVFRFSSLGNRGYGRAHDWTRRQRLQLDSLHQPGGHAFNDWWERLHASKPDLFALQPDGMRSGFPRPENAKLCQSNPAVWEQWLCEVAAQLESNPMQTVFNGSPNDGWLSGHCICRHCNAWDHPDAEKRHFNWKGVSGEHVALSDRHVTFANHLARRLKESYPERDYYVSMLSYGHSRPVPLKAVPDGNVIIACVANFFGRSDLKDRGSPSGTTHREQFAGWARIAPQVMWRPNTGSPCGWQQGLPDLSIKQTGKDLKFVAENRCIGIYIDSVWEHWATQGPQYYVMAQLAWDHDKDVELILDDFYSRGFGLAADDVRAYFLLFEEARRDFVQAHGYSAGLFEMTKLYTDSLLAEGERLLTSARKRVASQSEIYRRRLEFVRAGLDYTRLAVCNIELMAQYSRQPDERIAKAVRDNWKDIERLCEDYPYSVNWGPIRPQTSRMQGMHPDFPGKKNRLKAKDHKIGNNGFDRD